MKIQLNEDYRVSSDPLNFILQERKINQKSHEEYWKDIGYYSNLEQLLSGLFKKRLQASEIEGIQLLIDEIKNAVRAIQTQIKRLGG